MITGLTTTETALVTQLTTQLDQHQSANNSAQAYYEGSATVRDLGIAKPPELASFTAVSGWPAIAVDVLEERLEWQGFQDDDGTGVNDVVAANHLTVEASQAHLDALIYGVSFVRVGVGGPGEPDVLVTVESPTTTTGILDLRTRKLSSALTRVMGADGQVARMVLLTRDEQITMERVAGGTLKVVDRASHGLGIVPCVAFPNRRRASRTQGRSEITKSLRHVTDVAVRTLIGMEISREFYSSPQRYALGLTEDDFVRSDGTKVSKWEAVAGSLWAVQRDSKGQLPQLGQFTSSSPAPYLDALRGLAQIASAEAAVPPSYLGLVSDNPASADAIRAGEARLVKRAERRQATFGRAWTHVGELIARTLDANPDTTLASAWRDAATPTQASATDAATKLVGAGVLPPESDITLQLIGLTPDQVSKVRADRAAAVTGAGFLTQAFAENV